MDNKEHVLELIPEFALNLLDESQVRQISKHISSCDLCREELRLYQDVVSSLALAAPSRQPPARLKKALMQGIEQESTTSKAKAADRWWQVLEGYFQGKNLAWNALVLLLIFVLAASNLILWNRLDQTQAALQQQSSLRTVLLEGTGAAPLATGMLVISKNGEYGTLVVDHLPVLDEGLQYQLWLIRSDIRYNGGVFSVSDEGYGVLEIESAEPLSSFPEFGITIEPLGGSPGPTGEKVLGGQL